MSYSYLKNSSNKDIGSQYPQIQQMGGSFHMDAKDSIYNVVSREKPKFSPNLDHFILHPKAKLTDFISSVQIPSGFIVSEQVKALLDEFDLVDHIYWQASIEYKGEILNNYHWLFLYDDVRNEIEYEQTEFIIRDSFGDAEPAGRITSNRDLEKLYRNISSMKNIRSNEIFLNSKSRSLDLFQLHQADSRVFISERLKEKLYHEKITGIETGDIGFKITKL